MKPSWAAKHISDLMKKSRSTVVFTGAGMSTESGLPDFRSNGGLWDGKDPMKVSHVDMLTKDFGTIADFYRQRIQDAQDHAPNRGHQILAEWQQQGSIHHIATQNIDQYHTRAGNYNVSELHGNLSTRCSFCNKEYGGQFYLDNPDNKALICQESMHGDICGGSIRPNVVMFGEALPDEPWQKAKRAFKKADLCLILGSSCSVYPANQLPYETIHRGGEIAIINIGDTELDYQASYKISEWNITRSLEQINKFLRD
jgi:NAD-dependent deacetylase